VMGIREASVDITKPSRVHVRFVLSGVFVDCAIFRTPDRYAWIDEFVFKDSEWRY
jgi:hypothetical protein